jgi:hypothetical protein
MLLSAGLGMAPPSMTTDEHRKRALWVLVFISRLRKRLLEDLGRDLRSMGSGSYRLVGPDDVVPLAEEDFFDEVQKSAGKFGTKAKHADAKTEGEALRESRDAQARVAWVESVARRAKGQKTN